MASAKLGKALGRLGSYKGSLGKLGGSLDCSRVKSGVKCAGVNVRAMVGSIGEVGFC